MGWIILLLAGLLEVAWTIGLKHTHGFTRPWPTLLTVFALALSVLLLERAVRFLPLGTAYATWTGIGAVGAMLAGILLWHEPATWPRLLCVGLIVCGIVGLRLFE